MIDRRGFLVGALASSGGLVAAACSHRSGSRATGVKPGAGPSGGGPLTGDWAMVGLAAGLENLAVSFYQAGLEAATAGRLGTVPAVFITVAQTVQRHHKDHASAWNALLTASGRPAVTGVDTTLKQALVDPGLAQVKDVAGLARLALTLEDAAAATYLSGIGTLADKEAIQTAASVHPVEMQHSAVLSFILGEYPVPNAFAKTDGARPPGDAIG